MKIVKEESKIVEEEINLEDLIILGEDTQIPISIEYPIIVDNKKTTKKVKARIKPVTLKELDGINLNKGDMVESQIRILKKNLFKPNGENFSREEIIALPIGIINKVIENIMDISGVDYDINNLRDF